MGIIAGFVKAVSAAPVHVFIKGVYSPNRTLNVIVATCDGLAPSTTKKGRLT
jgi:hypothetical protein